MAGKDSPFYEVPKDVREFAEKNFEQARTAFQGLAVAARQAVHNAGNQMETAVSGANDIRNTALQMAEQNVASSFAFAQQLLNAKDMQEVMSLQAEFVKKQMDALSEQAKSLGQKAGKMGGGR